MDGFRFARAGKNKMKSLILSTLAGGPAAKNVNGMVGYGQSVQFPPQPLHALRRRIYSIEMSRRANAVAVHAAQRPAYGGHETLAGGP